jgi:hypothetical protein
MIFGIGKLAYLLTTEKLYNNLKALNYTFVSKGLVETKINNDKKLKRL